MIRFDYSNISWSSDFILGVSRGSELSLFGIYKNAHLELILSNQQIDFNNRFFLFLFLEESNLFGEMKLVLDFLKLSNYTFQVIAYKIQLCYYYCFLYILKNTSSALD